MVSSPLHKTPAYSSPKYYRISINTRDELLCRYIVLQPIGRIMRFLTLCQYRSDLPIMKTDLCVNSRYASQHILSQFPNPGLQYTLECMARMTLLMAVWLLQACLRSYTDRRKREPAINRRPHQIQN